MSSNQPNVQPSNGLGIAGFVISLVGICTGGVLSPIGMILSFIAMFKEPRGLAIAGFVLGVLGSFWVFLVFGVFGLAAVLAALGIASASGLIEYGIDSIAISEAVQQEYREAGAAPADLSSLGLTQDTLTDAWGNAYRYEVSEDGAGFSLISNGADGQPDTADDIEGEYSFGG